MSLCSFQCPWSHLSTAPYCSFSCSAPLHIQCPSHTSVWHYHIGTNAKCLIRIVYPKFTRTNACNNMGLAIQRAANREIVSLDLQNLNFFKEWSFLSQNNNNNNNDKIILNYNAISL